MAKSVEYEIKLLDSPKNAANLRALRDSVSATVKQMQAEMNRLQVPQFAGAGVGGGGPSIGASAPPRFTPPSSAGSVPGGAGTVPDYGSQLDGLKKLNNELAGVESSAKEAAAALAGVGQTPFGSVVDDAAAAVQEMGKLTDRSNELRDKLFQNTQDLTGSIDGVAGGLGKLAGGIAFLSAGNEDLQKVINTILTIKGTVEVFTGASQAVTSAVKTFSLFQQRSLLVAEQSENQAKQQRLAEQAARDLSAALRQQASAAQASGSGLASQARQAARLADELDRAADAARRSKASGRGGRGRGLGAAVGGAVGGSGLLAQFGGLGLEGLLGGLGTGGVGAGGSAAAGTIGAVAGPVAAAAAALGSLALVGTELYEITTGQANQVGSVTDTIASWEVQLVASAGELTGAFDLVGNTALANAERLRIASMQSELLADSQLRASVSVQRVVDEYASQFPQIRRLAAESGIISGGKAANLNLRDSESVFNRESRSREKIIDALDRATAAFGNEEVKRQAVSLVAGGKTADDVASELGVRTADIEQWVLQSERLNKLSEDYNQSISASKNAFAGILNAQQGVIAAVKQEAEERRRINSASINAANQRLGLLEKERGIFQSAEDRLNSAAERFAELSKSEQQAVLRAQDRAQAGRQLSRADRQRLDSLGLGAESGLVSQQRRELAARAGFFGRFGSFEQSQIGGSRQRLAELNRLQSMGAGIDPSRSRLAERQQRELAKQQELLSRQQEEASRQTGFQQSQADRLFGAARQSIQAEVGVRNQLDVKLQMDSQSVVQSIVRSVESLVQQQNKVIMEQVRRELQTRRAVDASTVRAQQA